MISALRDQIFMLSCIRYGVVAVQGRGLDDLPPECLAQYSATLVSNLERTTLYHAFESLISMLLAEMWQIDVGLHEKLQSTLQELVKSSVESVEEG